MVPLMVELGLVLIVVIAGSTWLPRMVAVSVLVLFAVVISAPVLPSSPTSTVLVIVVLMATIGALTAKSMVPVAPMARLAERVAVHTVPATAPSAHDQAPELFARLKVVPAGTVEVMVTGPEATLAVFSLA